MCVILSVSVRTCARTNAACVSVPWATRRGEQCDYQWGRDLRLSQRWIFVSRYWDEAPSKRCRLVSCSSRTPLCEKDGFWRCGREEQGTAWWFDLENWDVSGSDALSVRYTCRDYRGRIAKRREVEQHVTMSHTADTIGTYLFQCDLQRVGVLDEKVAHQGVASATVSNPRTSIVFRFFSQPTITRIESGRGWQDIHTHNWSRLQIHRHCLSTQQLPDCCRKIVVGA